MKLTIESVKGFHEFVKSIKMIAPGATFIISQKGCVVKARNESQSLRAYYRTNVIKAPEAGDEVVRLPILDLSKLLQAVKMVVETNKDDDTAEFKVTKQFVTYNGKAKFKLRLFNEAHLIFHTTEDIRTATTEIFSTTIPDERYKYVLRYKSITGEKDPKIYVYIKDDKVFAEHDDKTQNLIDSLGIEVSDEYEGELRNPICININNAFSKFNPLGANEISLSLQAVNGKPAFVKVKSVVQEPTHLTALEMVSKILEK